MDGMRGLDAWITGNYGEDQHAIPFGTECEECNGPVMKEQGPCYDCGDRGRYVHEDCCPGHGTCRCCEETDIPTDETCETCGLCGECCEATHCETVCQDCGEPLIAALGPRVYVCQWQYEDMTGEQIASGDIPDNATVWPVGKGDRR